MISCINLWSFPEAYGLEQCLDTASAAGFAAVEPNFFEHGVLSMDSPDGEWLQARRMAQDKGLALSSLSTGVYWAASPTSNDAATRARALELCKRQLEAAALLGVDTILVVPGSVKGADSGDAVGYDAAYERALDFIRRAEPHARSCGVAIGVENVWNKFLLSPLEMRAFVDAAGSPFVRAYFDVGNVLLYGYPEQWISILGSRIARVHVKDFRCAVGTLDGFCDLLAGDVNFPAVMAALRAVGYDGYITAEMGGYRYGGDQIVYNTSAAMGRILKM